MNKFHVLNSIRQAKGAKMFSEISKVDVVPDCIFPTIFLLNVLAKVIPVDVVSNTLVELGREPKTSQSNRAFL